MGTVVHYMCLAHFPVCKNYVCEDVFFNKKRHLITKEMAGKPKILPVKKSYENFYNGVFNGISMPRWNMFHDDFDLVHSINEPIIGKSKWILDLEYPDILFVNYGAKKEFTYFGKLLVKKIIYNENCKKVIFWSEACKNAFEEIYGKFTEGEVVRPGIYLPKNRKIKKSDEKINILFVGNDYKRKGGLELLKAFKFLNKTNDISMDFISSSVENNVKRKYPEVNFHESCSREMIYSDFYPNTDIFVSMSACETLSMALLEAMSFKIPIISSKTIMHNLSNRPCVNSLPELIKEGENTLCVSNDLFCGYDVNNNWYMNGKIKQKEVIDALKLMMTNDSLRKKLSKEGYKLVSKGEFSIQSRNKKLKKIYKEAIE
jgi:glycosyltransferase involved in cell wall biosynthesis